MGPFESGVLSQLSLVGAGGGRLVSFFLKNTEKVSFSRKCELRTRFFCIWTMDSSSSLVAHGPRRRKKAGLVPSWVISPRISSTPPPHASRTNTAPDMKRFFRAFLHGTFYGGSCGIALNSTTRRHPRLGLVSGSRGPTQIHIRGLCHWAGEPAGHLGAESPSRRTARPASARKTSSPCPHWLRGLSLAHHVNAVSRHRRVPPFASSRRPSSLTRLPICSGKKSHPGL